ncbi:hypothetical protein ACWKWU_04370 [Chitinophaga lutea]
MKNHIILLCMLLFAGRAAAQSLADLERQLDSLLSTPPKSEVTVGLGFGNNPAYGGKTTDPFRPVTMKPFLSPRVMYTHKTGLFASTQAYYLFNAERRPWFELDLSAGYDYTKNRRFLTGVAYTKYFYRDSSDVPATPITNELYAYFFYRKWWLEPGIALDFGWGRYREEPTPGYKQTTWGSDFNAIFDLRHVFVYLDVLKNDDAILLMPSTSFTMGTARYYSNLKGAQYVSRSSLIERRSKKNRGRGNNNGGGGQVEETDISVSDKTGFQPRAVDFGLRASYIIGKVAISPSYTLFKLLQSGDSGVTGYFTATVSLTL